MLRTVEDRTTFSYTCSDNGRRRKRSFNVTNMVTKPFYIDESFYWISGDELCVLDQYGTSTVVIKDPLLRSVVGFSISHMADLYVEVCTAEHKVYTYEYAHEYGARFVEYTGTIMWP